MYSKNLILLIVFSVFLSLMSYGQLSEKGVPYSLTKSLSGLKVPITQMGQISMAQIEQEDRVNDFVSGIPYRFGIEHEVDLGLSNSGIWEDLPNGDRLWRLAITAPKAKSINLVFDDYYLPEGAKLFIYNKGYDQILGAFTSRNNKRNGTFSTALVYGETSYLEYYEPAEEQGIGRLNISMVVHGYRSIFNKSNVHLGNSGNCNIDTECTQADNWRQELKSVGKTVAGGGLCSGTLVANTTGDRRPLFLTANHCGFANTVVVYWRFERPDCGSGTPDDTQTTSGATLLADVDGNPGGTIRSSDHLLMELDENPADSYDVYFAGWDANGDPIQSVTGIHHPAGDAKKISMENDDIISTVYLENPVDPDGFHWRVIDWDSGTTEGGSSGSPLFDNSTKRLVGMLSGGFAACGNNDSDWYGKFSVAWSNNGTTDPSERLSDWLDPTNTGILAIDGYGVSDIMISSTSSQINTCATDVDFDFDLTLATSVNSVTFSATGLPVGTSASFDTNPATTNGTYTLSITGIAGAAAGSYMITLNATDGTTSEDFIFELILDEVITNAPSLLTPPDGTIGESANPVFSWSPIVGAIDYLVEVATESTFTNIVDSGMTTNTSYVGPVLSSNTQYFWRVTAQNSCGMGPISVVFSFETGNIICQSYTASDTPITIPTSGPPNTHVSTITITDSGNITDLNILNLDIQHTWIADLTVTLTHLETGTSATLFSQICFMEDNVLGTFDDGGGVIPCPPNGGNYAPEEPFSIFIGESIAGTWTLTIDDAAVLDGGSLESWTLELCGNITTNSDCPTNYTLTGVQSMSEDFETDGTIISDQMISSNATVDYDSGVSVSLEENFETELGVTFHAFIDGCVGAMLQDDDPNMINK